MSSSGIHEESHYEILNLTSDAIPADIINAYREAKLIFQTDSLATYSLYSDEELESIMAKIDEAYRTLSDSEQRCEYDKKIAGRLIGKAGNRPKSKLQSSESAAGGRIKNSHIVLPSHLCGDKLKEIRRSQNITLDEIVASTKISKTYLRAIEADDFSTLPAPVYTRSYIQQYASAIGLSPELVLEAYEAFHAQE